MTCGRVSHLTLEGSPSRTRHDRRLPLCELCIAVNAPALFEAMLGVGNVHISSGARDELERTRKSALEYAREEIGA